MKIELKNIKIVEKLSEETICFTAKIYVDGKHVGEANNRGHGGCSDCFFFSPETRQAVDSYVATLPLDVWEYEGQKYTRKLSIDDVVDQIVEKFHNEKQDKKLDKISQKHKKAFADKGFPFTLELRLPHKVEWTAVRREIDIAASKAKMAADHKVSEDNIKLL